jgi:hypothetical protein
MALFHTDNRTYFNMGQLATVAHATVANSSLITRCANGDLEAIKALKLGFWPFTRDVERAIDRLATSGRLPRAPLYDKFGKSATRQTFLDSAKTIRRLEESELTKVFDLARGQLVEMQKDEKRHSFHWKADAENVGITYDQLQAEPVVPGVQRLIDATELDDNVAFFSMALASTEFIAEELGEVLAHNPAYTQQFKRGRAIWMEVHTVPHDGEPSHEEIVMDFARAYDMSGSPKRIEALVIEGILAFGVAADEVEARFAAHSKLVAVE